MVIFSKLMLEWMLKQDKEMKKWMHLLEE
jgi:hypothetical protein